MAEIKEEKETKDVQPMSLDEDDKKNETLKLQSKDGDIVEVAKNVVMCSKMIVEACDDMMAKGEETITLNLTTIQLKAIIEWCEYHKDVKPSEIEKPLKSHVWDECVTDPFDRKFCDRPLKDIYEIMLAANYLAIEPLMLMAAANVACFMKARTPQQMREDLKVDKDLTPEEEARIRRENKDLLGME